MIYKCEQLQSRCFSPRLYPTLCSIPSKGPNASNNMYDLVLFGGWVSFGDQPCNSVEYFDSSNKQWITIFTKGTAPTPRAQHSACALGNLIYVFGGCDSDANRNSSLHVLDTQDWTWSEIKSDTEGPGPLSSHTACIVPFVGSEPGPCMLIFGGTDGIFTFSDLWSFSFRKKSWSLIELDSFTNDNNEDLVMENDNKSVMATPACRLYHSSLLVPPSQMYIFGGAPDAKTTTAEDEVFSDLWVLDAGELTWREIKPKGKSPTRRGSTSMCYIEPFILLFGGFDGVREYDDCFTFDTQLEIWREVSLTTIPRIRCGHVAALIGPRSMILCCGCCMTFDTCMDDTFIITVPDTTLLEITSRYMIKNGLVNFVK